MEGLFSTLEVSAPEPDARPGYRLRRLEVYNWGTFDQRVWRLDLGGENTLLTGDIGSGKSTLVDAVTTLLLPAHRINYNKAAGAETRERSLRSYVLGHYRSEQVESSGSSRPVGLRDHRHYSVVLGVFHNTGHDAEVTLAQVFWMRDTSQGQPNRFFVTADRELSISADFADFGSDLAALKRRLREAGATVSDHFPDYGTRARRLLGIHSEQALELLHQTISMKSVGNLTEFVRQHMLEGADAKSRVDSLISHFEDLTRAHDAVRRAKDQLAALDPLLAHCDTHDRLGEEMEQDRFRREGLRPWLAGHQVRLLEDEHTQASTELTSVDGERAAVADRLGMLAGEQQRLTLAREGAGGSRVAQLERELEIERTRKDERGQRAKEHAELLRGASLGEVADAEGFARMRGRIEERLVELGEHVTDLANRRTELGVERVRATDESARINTELRSLQGRESNIDARSQAIRSALADALGVDDGELPFAGELIAVRPEHAAWQGAAERVLRGFALSVLVPAEHYEAASAWIDSRHLGGRLVYFRVAPRLTPDPTSTPLRPQRVLADLLEIKPGRFAEWMEREVARRADLVCVETVAQLREERFAVTIAGQVKGGGGRHEKDDRFRIDDRTRWVLGWSNEDKIDALLASARVAQVRGDEVAAALRTLDDDLGTLEQERRTLDKLSVFTQWSDLDWRTCAATITRLEKELAELQRGNEELARLTARLAVLGEEITEARARHDALTERRGALAGRLQSLTAQLDEARGVRDRREHEDREVWAAVLADLDAWCPVPATVAEVTRIEREQGDLLTDRIEKAGEKQRLAGQRAVSAMQAFRTDWPTETTEMDTSIAAAAEFRTLRDRLAGDDLPRFEAEFKKQLNTNTINDIAGFQAWLDRSATLIRERIATINESLRAIEYNPGRYITIVPQLTTHQEIRAFREELRACTDDALAQDDQYSEQRFLQVKRILERFRGRTGQAETDKRWTQLVTDVRNWFVFAASERWRDSDDEWEHYTDSDGKSGGQKEKLAYTILAASLAYQFRLEWGVAVSKDFRFVVIDEAFGRGSDASTRYALELFRKLGLQLLIVTPLQKVHIIEPYVAAVGFVENRTGELSRLQTLTIEDYRRMRATQALGAVEDVR